MKVNAEQSASMDDLDAVIIGAGPAGTAAAAILAEQGRRVLVLERETFPRYHIGESLLPFCYGPLKRLGLIEKLKASHFVKKYSVQFVSASGRASQPFYFFDRYDRETVAQTWQILRSEFDQMLVENAQRKGATIREGVTVTSLLRDGETVVGVRARDRGGHEFECRAPITLDCSGKDAFSAVRNEWRVADPYLRKMAVWTYYRGAKRDEGIDEGATTVAMVPEKGWFWYIPQHDDMVSVGVVAEPKYLTRHGFKDLKQIFEREVKQNRWVEEHLAAGQQVGNYFVTSEFSFHSRHCGCPGLLLVGDAFCFLDPVFSSGIMLALKSGVMAADAVHAGLQSGDLSPERFSGYAAFLREGIENMRKLVYAFYDPNFSFRMITDKHPEAAGDITDCLSGDVNKDFSRLWEHIREVATLPNELPYGQPLAPGKDLAASIQ